jgi:hypothetical protein
LKGRIVALLIAAVLVVSIVLLLNRGGERHLDQGAVHFLGSTIPAFEPFIAKQLPTAMRELNGRVVTSVSLPPARGVVLLHR